MNEDRDNIMVLPEFLKFRHIGFVEGLHRPSPGIAAEDLHAGAAELVGALHGKGEAAGDGDVEPDSQRNCLTIIRHDVNLASILIVSSLLLSKLALPAPFFSFFQRPLHEANKLLSLLLNSTSYGSFADPWTKNFIISIAILFDISFYY